MIEPIPFAGLVEIGDPETKYCSSCVSYKPFASGKIIQTANRKMKRFKCGDCLASSSARKYGGTKSA